LIAAPQQAPRPLPLFLELLRSETAASPDRRAAALAGLRAYQSADRGTARSVPHAIAQAGRASLRDYGGGGRPVVFVPSLINPPFILNLSEENSLTRFVANHGFRPLLVDWGDPEPGDRDQDVTAHVEQLLLPLLDALDEPPVLIGYCLGGTMALAAACARPAAGLCLIAAPWKFSGFGTMLGEIEAMWEQAEPTCNALGLVPMEVLQAGFWMLDPARTVAKFERFARLAPDSKAAREFVTLEDWANAGSPLTYAAGRQMFDDFFVADLPGTGRWQVGGAIADPRRLACPATQFVSAIDRIVPAATAAPLGRRKPIDAGHVGMVIGSQARKRLWNPMLQWLRGLPK
jgi:polyhydroxyalkanoate synthase